MTELLTAAQMRTIEAAAIASGEVTGLELMERAGRGVVEAIFEEWPEMKAGSFHAVVLCGPGNNGGDGFVVARLLKEWGWEVEVFLYGDPEKLPPDARVNYERWEEIGHAQVFSRANLEQAATGDYRVPLVVVDAVFGIGLTRPLPGDLTRAWDGFCDTASNLSSVGDLFLVAVDVPSGVSDDLPGGERLAWFDDGEVSMLTVTFHAQKAAHGRMLARGERIAVVDIGLPGFVRPESAR